MTKTPSKKEISRKFLSTLQPGDLIQYVSSLKYCCTVRPAHAQFNEYINLRTGDILLFLGAEHKPPESTYCFDSTETTFLFGSQKVFFSGGFVDNFVKL